MGSGAATPADVWVLDVASGRLIRRFDGHGGLHCYDLGAPLDRSGVVTPGSIDMSFVIAWYDGDLRQYTAYTTRVQTSPITGVSEEQAQPFEGVSTEDELLDALDARSTHQPYD